MQQFLNCRLRHTDYQCVISVVFCVCFFTALNSIYLCGVFLTVDGKRLAHFDPSFFFFFAPEILFIAGDFLL